MRIDDLMPNSLGHEMTSKVIEIAAEEKIESQMKQNTPYQCQGREGGADTSALKI